jgi:hypothetical protein
MASTPRTSVGSSVQWGSVTTEDVRSITISNNALSMVDATHLQEDFARTIVGQAQIPQITVTVLTNLWGHDCLGNAATGAAIPSDDLYIVWGAGYTPAKSYGACVLVDVSAAVSVDTTVEWTYVFQPLIPKWAEAE